MKGDLELVARDGIAVRVGFTSSGFGVGTRNALVSDAKLGAVHRGGREVGDGEGLGLGLECGGVMESLDGHKVEILKGGVVAVDRGYVVRSRGLGLGLGILLRDDLGLAGEDGAGALPVGAGGADGIGVGERVVSVGALDGEGAGGGGRASGPEEGVGRGEGGGGGGDKRVHGELVGLRNGVWIWIWIWIWIWCVLEALLR